MSRRLWLTCTLYFSLSLFSQASKFQTSTPSGVEVVYVQDGTSITTYNVDPQTFQPTQVGQPFQLEDPNFAYLYSAPDDRAIYVSSYDTNLNFHLTAYQTDSSGVPQSPALQRISAEIVSFQVDPAADFAYAVLQFPNWVYEIRRYAIDPKTGKLSSPHLIEKYPPSGPCSGSDFSGLGLFGFNATGSEIYENWGCDYHDSYTELYYERTVNLKNGNLGPEKQIYSWSNGDQGFDRVAFAGNHIVDFNVPNDYQQGISTLNVYPLKPNSKAIIQCDARMLEACGYALDEITHPSGRYVFFKTAPDYAQIASINYSAKTVIDTGNYVPYEVWTLSPDGTIIYSYNPQNGNYTIPIYGFNTADGTVTSGGQIFASSGLDSFFVALRQ